jgi:transketolase
MALTHRDGPVALALTRQKLPLIDSEAHAGAEGVRRGGYVLADVPRGAAPNAVLIATGSEVALALSAGAALADQGVQVRVVSLPSQELFAAQDETYRARECRGAMPSAPEAKSPWTAPSRRWQSGHHILIILRRHRSPSNHPTSAFD